MQYGIAFAIVFVLVMVLMPAFSVLARRMDFTDKPTKRKKHKHPMPLSGGVVMFIAVAVGFLFFLILAESVETADYTLWAVLGGAALIVIVGLVDDFSKAKGKDFPVWPRLLVQVGAASLAFAAGVRFTGFMNPFTEYYVYLPIGAQYILTMLWFVGLMTAFNFMDGLDGLSGLLALGSGVTFFIVALNMGQPESAFMAIIFVAAVSGFLRYNLPPAKVYMGDSGAYLLGFILAAISLHGAFKQATVISLTIPMLALGVPIFDSILVVVRRVLARKPAHIADSSDITHLHFRLLKDGMKPSHAVLLIFLLSACLNLASIIIMLAF
ncbi:MAG: undecaprenyl/decaprenyl-phosphate alpha-N-acetylglucosaminyl 1-phosphate transferase [Defluviitaleaceae bacterium]|nr:undecaprenyl/decaprenyl-phosphate alpha-N-acetylglucosaminyl 1-phosphate transferase [Defluviitaleaceae bacterium]